MLDSPDKDSFTPTAPKAPSPVELGRHLRTLVPDSTEVRTEAFLEWCEEVGLDVAFCYRLEVYDLATIVHAYACEDGKLVVASDGAGSLEPVVSPATVIRSSPPVPSPLQDVPDNQLEFGEAA